MPELPEVETVRRGLVPALEGRRLVGAEVRREGLRRPFPPRLAERLEGARVEGLRRRAKVLLLDLSTGETMLVHLGMSGRVTVSGRTLGEYVHDVGDAAKHDHLVLRTEGGVRVALNDARRFGAVDLWPTADLAAHPMLAGLGPEPLEAGFDGAALGRRLAGRRSPIKAALLDGRVVAGLGNIYVCEALHRARVSPRREAGRVSAARLARLAPAIQAVLREAIEAGGSTLRDHRQASGEIGRFQHRFRVYGREGAPCPTEGCGGVVRRTPQGGRSTFHCPVCQR